MTDRTDITESMINAAMNVARMRGVTATHDDMRRMLVAGLAKMPGKESGPPFDLWVNTSITMKKARFLGTTERRAYFRVETEDGKTLTVHGNDIQPSRGPN